jgi:hypothetical protein
MMMKTLQFAGRTIAIRLPLLLLAALALSSTATWGQALPTAEAAPLSTGFALPTTLGTLQYAVTASQSFIWGYYSGTGATSSTNLSGDLAYLSNSKEHPFSMILSAGHSFGEDGEPGYNFVGLAFSQVANAGRWNFVLSDNLNYLPGTPAAGLSGIPGVGDLGIGQVQILGDSGQGLLTNFSNRISNGTAVTVSRLLTGKTSLSGSGSYTINRFLDTDITSSAQSSAGLDSDAVSGQGGITHQIDRNSSLGVNYTYSNFTYPNDSFGIPTAGFVSQTASAQYSHRFNRKLSFSASAGPQWTTIQTAGDPTSTSLFANVSANYAGKNLTSGLVFARSSNNGFGATAGALSNSLVLTANRSINVAWNVSGSASYTQTSTLAAANFPTYSTDTYVEAIQVSRAIVRNLSGFVSYTFEDQSDAGINAIDAFSGRSQVLSFGITYSPGSMHLGHP